MSEPFVHIEDLTVQYANKVVLTDLVWMYGKGDNWVLRGASGTGKSTLAKAIGGHLKATGVVRIALDANTVCRPQVLYVPNWYAFTNLEGERHFYYQQRYNTHQAQDTLTVRADLIHYGDKEGLCFEDVRQLLAMLDFEALLDSQLITLSSGEHKKIQLIKALWSRPQLLILDEPYTGLDVVSRESLNTILDQLVSEGLHIILISNDQSLPRTINKFAEIRAGKFVEVGRMDAIEKPTRREERSLPSFLRERPTQYSESMVVLRDVRVGYGDKAVLKGVSWEVKAGEKWLLQGPNGSGKSTLLSLITGDHPQAYGHDITLFGKKRGSGESIWDIKEKIGVISPEMHWYFDPQATVWHTVASVFFDSIGWFKEVNFEEQQHINALLGFFDLTAERDDLLHTLPLGKQRLALLARTIVKNPPLLVLDEPCQGLDADQTKYFNEVVDELCKHGKTLIYVGHYDSHLPACIEHKLILDNGEVALRESVLENIL